MARATHSAGPGLGLRLAAGVAAGLSVLGLLSAAGGLIESLDLLNHVTPLLALGGLAGIWIGLSHPTLRQGRLLAVLGLLAMIATLPRVLPEFWPPPPVQSPPRAPAVLTLLSQNVWDRNPDPHHTARTLAATGADIIVLQELDTERARLVARDLERVYPYAADCSLANRWCAMAILSRYPISAWSYHQGGWKAPDYDRLVMVRATINAARLGRFDVIDAKLVHPYTPDIQRDQTARLIDKVRAFDQGQTILAGDFNLTPWTFALHRLDRAFEMTRRTRGLATWPNRLPVSGPTIRAPFPALPIDQVYAGPQWRTLDVRRGPRTDSDHYGVLITLTPAPTP